MSRLSEKYGSKVSAKEAKAIQKAMDEQKENRNKFKEVPAGEYKVVVDKLELGETSWGDPQITLWFKITDGEFKNSRIFYNGSFDDHFEHGINSTAILLADLLDDEEQHERLMISERMVTDENGKPYELAHTYQVDLREVWRSPEKYASVISLWERDTFPTKKAYQAIVNYYETLKEKHAHAEELDDDDF